MSKTGQPTRDDRSLDGHDDQQEAEALLLKHGCPASSLPTVAQASQDEQVAERGSRVFGSRRSWPLMRHIALFNSNTLTRRSIRACASQRGRRHITGELGYSQAELRQLRQQALM